MSVSDVAKHGAVALSESMYKEFATTGTPIGPMAQAFGERLEARLTGGYPPSEVADQVVRGIRENVSTSCRPSPR